MPVNHSEFNHSDIKTLLRPLLLAAAAFCCLFFAGAATVGYRWQPDPLLGGDFEQATIRQPDDYDGPVVCTVVRSSALEECCPRGILYVHGYNDYFFQAEMAGVFNDSCWSFYAVDLRKYGRSIRDRATRYHAREMDEYFADIDAALKVMRNDGIERVALMGHSTGGLITAYYMAKSASPLKRMVKALLLNSPFLDWNFTGAMKSVAIPAVSAFGMLLPDISIPQGDGGGGYSKSLLKSEHGEWDYDTELKLGYSLPVTSGWVHAVDCAQWYLRDHPYCIKVPVLLMHSARAVRSDGQGWNPDYQRGDAVLNPADILREGRRLSRHVTDLTVPDGLHDLVLSRPGVRKPLFQSIFRFLNKQKAFECF